MGDENGEGGRVKANMCAPSDHGVAGRTANRLMGGGGSAAFGSRRKKKKLKKNAQTRSHQLYTKFEILTIKLRQKK